MAEGRGEEEPARQLFRLPGGEVTLTVVKENGWEKDDVFRWKQRTARDLAVVLEEVEGVKYGVLCRIPRLDPCFLVFQLDQAYVVRTPECDNAHDPEQNLTVES